MIVRPRFSVETIIDVQNKLSEQHTQSNPAVETLRINLTRRDITVLSWGLALASVDAMADEGPSRPTSRAFDDPASHPAALRMLCRRLDETDRRVKAIEDAREAEADERLERLEREMLEHIDRMLAGDAHLAAHEALTELRSVFVGTAAHLDSIETALGQADLRRAWALFIVLALARGRAWSEDDIERMRSELARADADSLLEMARIAYGTEAVT